jgi:hypothetical protein
LVAGSIRGIEDQTARAAMGPLSAANAKTPPLAAEEKYRSGIG